MGAADACESAGMADPRYEDPMGQLQYYEKQDLLSLQLAEKPKECLEEVVVHEMVHLLEPGHNKRFYHYMDCFLPQWKIWKERLKNPL